MRYASSYLKTFLHFLSVAGAGYLGISALFFDPIAAYLVFCALIVAYAGPIALSMKKDTT